MSERWTERPELAELYDAECAGREDHDVYVRLAEELGATSVVDIGCGTGVFAVDLSRHGLQVFGVDPAAAMLDIARRRDNGAAVRWIHGCADDVPDTCADLAVMMGHVAQYFVDDDAWADALGQIHRILAPGGRVAFETRNPAIDWPGEWTRERTEAVYPHPAGGEFRSWVEVVDVTGDPDSYTMTHHGHSLLPDGRHLVAAETLRFRSVQEIQSGLDRAGFDIETMWGHWDRSPHHEASRELIVVARRH
jgi:SAM-dependent methyltransferase